MREINFPGGEEYPAASPKILVGGGREELKENHFSVPDTGEDKEESKPNGLRGKRTSSLWN